MTTRDFYCPECRVTVHALYGATAVHAPCRTKMTPVPQNTRTKSDICRMRDAGLSDEVFHHGRKP